MRKEENKDKSFIEEVGDFVVGNSVDFVNKMLNLKDVLQYKYKPKKGYTDYEEVYRNNKLRVLNYLPNEDKKYKTPLLFVYSVINRWYIVDLMEKRSLMRFLSEQGYDVYIMDWGIPSRSDKYFGWEEYIDELLNGAVDHLREATGQDKISLYGYCLGGTFTVIYSALYPEKVKNLLTMTTPVDFQTNGLFEKWTEEKYFDVERIHQTYGILPPDFLESSFAIKNMSSAIWKGQTFWKLLSSGKMLTNYFAMEGWLNDNVPFVTKLWKDVISDLYQHNKLIKGKLRIGGRAVELKKIDSSILNIVASRDNIVPPSASLCLNDLTSSKDAHDLILNGGHIGIVAGGIAAKKLWPGLDEWLSPRSGKK